MGHNPSRRNRAAAAAATQYEVDQYKARSIWGAWRSLKPEIRARYFNGDEIAWLSRYGSRLDQLSSLTVEPRKDTEKHFVGVCIGHIAPSTDRERLWLRAQMVVRYEASLERAARCGEAERARDAMALMLKTARADARQAQQDAAGVWAEMDVKIYNYMADWVQYRRGLCNVQQVLWYRPRPESSLPERMMSIAGECH